MLHRLFLATVFSLLAGVVLATPSSAGQVHVPRGRVLINQGEAFVLAQDRQALRAGDRLLLLPGSQVELEFPAGCRQSLLLPQVVLVGPDGACADVTEVAVLASNHDAGSAPDPLRFVGQRWWASAHGLGRVGEEDFFDTFGP